MANTKPSSREERGGGGKFAMGEKHAHNCFQSKLRGFCVSTVSIDRPANPIVRY
jgi:hypothetical protein